MSNRIIAATSVVAVLSCVPWIPAETDLVSQVRRLQQELEVERKERDRRIQELQEKLAAVLAELDSRPTARVTSETEHSPVHFHGYGELHFTGTSSNPTLGGADKADLHRMVWGLSYAFNDDWRLDTEVDFEHAASEPELEFAYLTYQASDTLGFRAGSLLMPVGRLNEFHEPPLFYSVERPALHSTVIPTTWNEAGVGVFGAPREDMSYRLYLVNGLDASRFRVRDGIRRGRGKAAKAEAESLALTGRLEWRHPRGWELGLSGYFGGAGQSAARDVDVSLLELDLRRRIGDWEFSATAARVDVSNTAALELATRTDVTGDGTPDAGTGALVGDTIGGYLAEIAYHFRDRFLPEGQDLVAFARYEVFDTLRDVDSTVAPFVTAADMTRSRQTIWRLGASYLPDPRIALKLDFGRLRLRDGSTQSQLNLGMAYMY